MHRDLKPENILLSDDSILKIGDLGTAKKLSEQFPFTNYVSTRWYRAPEWVINSTKYSSAVDVFALGCIMAEMYTLKPVFWGSWAKDQLKKYITILGTENFENWEGATIAKEKGFSYDKSHPECLDEVLKAASPSALNLLRSLLQFDPSKRIKMSKILKHEFFSKSKSQANIGRKIPLKNIYRKSEIVTFKHWTIELERYKSGLKRSAASGSPTAKNGQ